MLSILRRSLFMPLLILLEFISVGANAAPNHVIAFGKWNTVPYVADSAGSPQGKTVALKIRPLLVDGQVKEFTLGLAHDVTDRIFVVQRAFRINDSLPQDSPTAPHWQWQQGGWLLVDRVTGRISPINLPEFDASLSVVSWYRDYAAYWGASDDGKCYAVVAEINHRKPIVKILPATKAAKVAQDPAGPDCICQPPSWQRAPARVTFEENPSTKRTYVIRGHAGDLLGNEEAEEEASK
jgi:hypothetical protein